ncbi:MAG: hypothetical protein IJP52_03645 [Paludibacteraceae bacterium]|nr:hypothetical protein [Paludibacteraceae bacterium]
MKKKFEPIQFNYDVHGDARLKRTGLILRTNFWEEFNANYIFKKQGVTDHRLYEGQLGFDEHSAWNLGLSNFDQKEIFQTLSNSGYNLIFYWVDDDNVYSIFHEVYPTEVRLLPIKDYREGISIEDKYEPLDMHDEGKVVATFYRYNEKDEPNPIADTLTIKSVPIMDVIKRSVILFHEG